MILELTADTTYQTKLKQGCDTDILYTNLTEKYNFRNLMGSVTSPKRYIRAPKR